MASEVVAAWNSNVYFLRILCYIVGLSTSNNIFLIIALCAV